MKTLSNGTEQRIRQYFLSKYQPEWYEEKFGQCLTLNQLIQAIKTECPDDFPKVAAAAIRGLIDYRDPYENERRRNREQAHQALGIDPPSFLPDGVRVDAPSFVGLTNGKESEHISFAGFETRPKYPAVMKAASAVMDWLNFGKPMLTLFANPGVGKTHLAEAAAHTLKLRGEGIVFRTEPQMMGDIRKARSNFQGEEWIDAFSTVKWLVIDDLAVDALNEEYKAIRERIINERWLRADPLRTLVTTNVSGENLPPRIADRLGDVNKASTVSVRAVSYRRLGK